MRDFWALGIWILLHFFNCIFQHSVFLQRDNNKSTIKHIGNYEKLKTNLTEKIIWQSFLEQIKIRLKFSNVHEWYSLMLKHYLWAFLHKQTIEVTLQRIYFWKEFKTKTSAKILKKSLLRCKKEMQCCANGIIFRSSSCQHF